MYSRVRGGRTLEYVLPGCGILYSTPYPGVAHSRVRPTQVWRTLEYATTMEECTLESKSCLESVADPTVPRQFAYEHFVYDTSSTDISSTDFLSTTLYQRVGQLYIQLLF